MDTIITQKNLTTAEEKQFRAYIAKKIPAIERLLENYSDDSLMMRVNIEKFDKHDAYVVELCLSIPKNDNIIAKEASHEITKALDLSKDRLVAQIKKSLVTGRKTRTKETIREENLTSESMEDLGIEE